jgi:hypothetical protein
MEKYLKYKMKYLKFKYGGTDEFHSENRFVIILNPDHSVSIFDKLLSKTNVIGCQNLSSVRGIEPPHNEFVAKFSYEENSDYRICTMTRWFVTCDNRDNDSHLYELQSYINQTISEMIPFIISTYPPLDKSWKFIIGNIAAFVDGVYMLTQEQWLKLSDQQLSIVKLLYNHKEIIVHKVNNEWIFS